MKLSNTPNHVFRLAWDSDFFGFEIGRLDVNNLLELNYELLQEIAGDFRLVTVFTEHLIPTLEGRLFKDVKLTYSKLVKNYATELEIRPFDTKKDDFKELLDLAYLSGVHSRFLLDEGFKISEFERLYEEWLVTALSGQNESVVLVYSSGSILGFTTVEISKNKDARIGLIAVSENARGVGIASQLVKSAQKFLWNKGIKSLSVATQESNDAANNMYFNLGFQLKEKRVIYHFWNNDPF